MATAPSTYPMVFSGDMLRSCLSCGAALANHRRRYCSIDCRQTLRRKLNARTGLLKALHTRYAAFYFTGDIIVMDVLPWSSREIFSFIYPRSRTGVPADDFCRMSDMLGNAWWAERRRTNKKYLANMRVLNHATRNDGAGTGVHPVELRSPAVGTKALIHLKLSRKDLESEELHQTIKRAFRLQAKRHHPDVGGRNADFRRIVTAYENLIAWAESPTFIVRRGFPDKWFYTGERNRWVQPTPVPKF